MAAKLTCYRGLIDALKDGRIERKGDYDGIV
jgi:hypothetical protein